MEEKVAASLGKIARAESARIAHGTKYWKDLGFLAETLTRLANKDLSKDGGEAAFGTSHVVQRVKTLRSREVRRSDIVFCF
jgi:hypothetical protein